MTAHRATHRLATLCRVLGVSPSGYYAWRRRPLSPRARGDVTLSAQIQAIHTRPAGTSGGSRPARQGCQYREAGVRPSMGTMGDAYDNALCESFFATLECELQDRRRFPTQAEARMAVLDFIAGWYNPHRRHSGLDYLSPIS